MPRKISKIESYEEEQLVLSKERTILSFMRTGLTFVTAGIVVASFFSQTTAQVVGYILVGIGFVEVFESMRRLILKQKELSILRKKCGTSDSF
ncbi:MAG: DUF202 domain-containing protein [Candidatus Aenigmatarchaeota archaeon]